VLVLNVSRDGLQLLEKRGLLLLDAIVTSATSQASASPSLLLVALWLLLLALLGLWVVLDGGVSLLVHGLNAISRDAIGDVLGELSLVGVVVILLQVLHVVGNVQAKNVLAENVRLELLLVGVVAWEALGAVWHVKTTVSSTLHGAKDLGTSGGTRKTDIQVALEGAWLAIDVLNVVLDAVGFLRARVHLVQVELLEKTASEQQASSVGRCVVGKTHLDAEAWQLVRIGSGQDDVSLNASIRNLACDVFVGKSNHQTVLGRVVLVLLLQNQALSGIVVSLSLSSPLELDLETLEVSFVFNNFNIGHLG